MSCTGPAGPSPDETTRTLGDTVGRVDPGYATVELGETPGAYTILAQAVEDEGATRDIGVVTV